MFAIQTHGFKELSDALRAMPDNLMNKTISQALYQGSKIVRDEAKLKAPVHIGSYPLSRTSTVTANKALIDAAFAESNRLSTELQKSGPLSRKQIRAIKATVKQTLGATGRQMWNKIRKPGTLASSIVIKKQITPGGKDVIMRNVELTKFAYYGRWLEFGFTHYGKKKRTHVPAHPYFRPALYNNSEKVIDKFREYLIKFVNKAGKA
jgi:HK97 gp10 family phage protein